jgi:hypothetical protein
VILKSEPQGVVPAGGVVRKGVVAMRPTLTDNGLTVPLETSSGVVNDFIPASKLRVHPAPNVGDCL